jgi:hypothetical protein
MDRPALPAAAAAARSRLLRHELSGLGVHIHPSCGTIFGVLHTLHPTRTGKSPSPGRLAADGTLHAIPVSRNINPNRSKPKCKLSSPEPPGSQASEARHVHLRTIHAVVGSPLVGRHTFVARIQGRPQRDRRRKGLNRPEAGKCPARGKSSWSRTQCNLHFGALSKLSSACRKFSAGTASKHHQGLIEKRYAPCIALSAYFAVRQHGGYRRH